MLYINDFKKGVMMTNLSGLVDSSSLGDFYSQGNPHQRCHTHRGVDLMATDTGPCPLLQQGSLSRRLINTLKMFAVFEANKI